MASTMSNPYMTGRSTQEGRNTGSGTAKAPPSTNFELPVLPGISAYTGLSIPALIAVGALAWFLIQRYDSE